MIYLTIYFIGVIFFFITIWRLDLENFETWSDYCILNTICAFWPIGLLICSLFFIFGDYQRNI